MTIGCGHGHGHGHETLAVTARLVVLVATGKRVGLWRGYSHQLRALVMRLITYGEGWTHLCADNGCERDEEET